MPTIILQEFVMCAGILIASLFCFFKPPFLVHTLLQTFVYTYTYTQTHVFHWEKALQKSWCSVEDKSISAYEYPPRKVSLLRKRVFYIRGFLCHHGKAFKHVNPHLQSGVVAILVWCALCQIGFASQFDLFQLQLQIVIAGFVCFYERK